MLLLERCRDAAICIGDQIKVKVLRTGQHRVLLGIEAERGIPVWREELGPPVNKKTQEPAPSPLRVLVVEDDPAHRKLIQGLLADSGVANVTTVSTGEEAIPLLGDEQETPRPGLVILDLRLPGISGLDVLRRIKSADVLKATPVVMLSSVGDDEQINLCLQAGANAYVTKSSRLEDFRKSIFRIAEFWKNTRQVA